MSTYTQDITHLINKIDTNIPDNDTQYITAARIRDAMGAVAYNYDLYVLKTDLDTASYVTASQLEGLVTDQELQEGMQSVLDDSYAYVVDKINEIPGVDLSAYVDYNSLQSYLGSYVTKTELSDMGYITENDLPDMSAYMTKDELSAAGYVTSSDISDFVTEQDVQNILVEGGYITSNELSQMSYVTQSQLTQASYINTQYLDEASYTTLQEVSQQGFTTANDFKTINGYSIVGSGNIEITSGGTVDLSAYVTKDELSAAGYLTSIPSDYITESELSSMGYVTESQLQQAGYVSQTQLNESSYVTTSDLNTELSDYPTNNDLALTLQDYVSYSQFNTYTSDFVVDSDLESFVTYDYLEGQGYITINDVPTVDLSSYVTKSQLNQELGSYVTKTELSNAGYVTNTSLQSQLQQAGYLTSIPNNYATYDAISQMGYITSIPSDYVTESELSAMGYITSSALPTMSDYVSKTELSNAGYLTSIPNNYATYDAISQMGYITSSALSGLATETYVADYVAEHAPVPDLSAYVTKSQLNQELGSYVTKTELSNAGYLTSVPSDYATYDAISQMGYITSSDIPAIPVIDESIIPNTTATYTLGDSSHFYSDIYVNRLNGAATGMWVRLGGNDTVFIGSNSFRPATTNTHSLGTSSNQWSYTYSRNFIENGTNISDIYAQAYVLTQNQYDGLSQADKDKETIYIISDQQAYMNNELVTETSLDSRGFLTAANFNYDPTTGTLTLNL